MRSCHRPKCRYSFCQCIMHNAQFIIMTSANGCVRGLASGYIQASGQDVRHGCRERCISLNTAVAGGYRNAQVWPASESDVLASILTLGRIMRVCRCIDTTDTLRTRLMPVNSLKGMAEAAPGKREDGMEPRGFRRGVADLSLFSSGVSGKADLQS